MPACPQTLVRQVPVRTNYSAEVIPYSSLVGIWTFCLLAETPLLRDGHGERGGQRHARGQRSESLEVALHDLKPDARIENQGTEWTVGNNDQRRVLCAYLACIFDRSLRIRRETHRKRSVARSCERQNLTVYAVRRTDQHGSHTERSQSIAQIGDHGIRSPKADQVDGFRAGRIRAASSSVSRLTRSLNFSIDRIAAWLKPSTNAMPGERPDACASNACNLAS